MCGHAGFLRISHNGSTNNSAKNVVLNTFITSQMRGLHSSGASVLWKHEPKNNVIKKLKKKLRWGWTTYKGAGVDPTSVFFGVQALIQERGKKNGEDYKDDVDIQAMIGHSRHATLGEVISANAHPFTFFNNRFIGAHNGTIPNADEVLEKLQKEEPRKGTQETDKYTDPPEDKDYTDSEVILYCIYRWGIEKVYPLLTGAWAFVFYDELTKSINFIRNNQRTFFITWDYSSDCLFWSSEYEMLRFATKRELHAHKEEKIKWLRPHVLYSVDISKHRCVQNNWKDFVFSSTKELQTQKVITHNNTNVHKMYPANKKQDRKSHVTVDINHNKVKTENTTFSSLAGMLDSPEEEDKDYSKCIMCNADVLNDADALPVKGHGHVCGGCIKDLEIVEEVLDQYPETGISNDWVSLWLHLTREKEGDKSVKRIN